MDDIAPKRYDPNQPEFAVDMSEFLESDPDEDMDTQGNKPSTFKRTSYQVLIDFLTSIREHTEDFIESEVLPDATIVNKKPLVKWIITYPDVLDVPKNPDYKRRFIEAVYKAGYPVKPGQIPQESDDEDTYLERATSSKPRAAGGWDMMVEFISVGMCGAIGYSTLAALSPGEPKIANEKPFITILDDGSFLTARLCTLNPDYRFGVAQLPGCSGLPSPIWSLLPEEHIAFLLQEYLENTLLPGVDLATVTKENFNPTPEQEDEMGNYVRSLTITHWPHSPSWDAVLRFLMDDFKEDLANGVNIQSEKGRIKHTMSPIDFGTLIQVGFIMPFLGVVTSAQVHGSSVTDILLFDTDFGEGDAYTECLSWIIFPKSFSQIITRAQMAEWEESEEGQKNNIYLKMPQIFQHLVRRGALARASQSSHFKDDYDEEEEEDDDDDDEVVEADGGSSGDSNDPKTTIDKKTKDRLYYELQMSLALKAAGKSKSESIEEYLKREAPETTEEYRQLFLARPQNWGLHPNIGLMEVMSSELARIYGISLRT